MGEGESEGSKKKRVSNAMPSTGRKIARCGD